MGRRTLVWISVAVAAVFVVGAGLEGVIVYQARSESAKAISRFGLGQVDALIAQLECTSCAMKERNRAVWALGQLGDQRALAPLKAQLTGKPCDHSKYLCQHELTKAIRHLERGIPLQSVRRLGLGAGPR